MRQLYVTIVGGEQLHAEPLHDMADALKLATTYPTKQQINITENSKVVCVVTHIDWKMNV